MKWLNRINLRIELEKRVRRGAIGERGGGLLLITSLKLNKSKTNYKGRLCARPEMGRKQRLKS